jgi:TolB-like protein/Tfp pilus assembly protein PilF
LAVLASAALAYIAVSKFWLPKPAPAPSPVTSPSAPTAAIPAKSIAVLPLTNESGDPSQQYFSDGLSENLITELTRIPGLKVIGRTSAFQFRDSKEDAQSIGAKLGVARLLEGSVQRSGDAVRVSAELIDTADGRTQWSERYDRPYKDLFALQDDITHAVTEALRAKLLPSQHAQTQDERPPSGNLKAYNALLQGGFYASRSTEADYRKAIEYYTQATKLDPRYALAWSELAQAWISVGGLFGAPEAFANAQKAADRALTLSSELAAAHLARGFVLQYANFNWQGAEAEYRRGMELAPNDGEAKFFLGNQIATLGQLEPAIELTRQALVNEPLRAAWYNWLAIYLSGLNRLDEAEQVIRRAIELQPGAAWYHETLTIIEIQRGNAQAALDAARQETDRSWRNSALALAWQFAGDKNEADAGLKKLIDEDWAYQVAQVYALRGDSKSTFEWLDRSLNNRDAGIGFLLYDPFILRFKDDPRFAAFCRKVALPVPSEVAGRT